MTYPPPTPPQGEREKFGAPPLRWRRAIIIYPSPRVPFGCGEGKGGGEPCLLNIVDRGGESLLGQKLAAFLLGHKTGDFALRLVQVAEDAAFRRAGLHTGRLQATIQPVGAEVALHHHPFGNRLAGFPKGGFSFGGNNSGRYHCKSGLRTGRLPCKPGSRCTCCSPP